MVKRVFCFIVLMLLNCAFAENIQINIYSDGADSKYSNREYVRYKNPPRQSLMTNGFYVMSTSKVRYVHSPSRLKGAKHAARINYYNDMYD